MDDTLDLSGFEQSWGDLVSFYLGCSFTFEPALSNIGVRLLNMEQNKAVSMHVTNIGMKPVGLFSGFMYTSMRPVRKSQLGDVVRLTSQYPDSHGAPIHIGSPARIGVDNSSIPSPLDPGEEDLVSVFWACGFSVSQILADVGERIIINDNSP